MLKQEKTLWLRFRKFINDLHLWAGLIGGLFIFVICLTGTVLTFDKDVKEWINPQLYKVDIGSNKLPTEDLIAAAEKETGKKATSITINGEENKSVQLGMKTMGEKGRPTTYFVNQYTGEVLGSAKDERGSSFFMTMFRMHRWLLQDTEIGRPIVGVATLLFVFGCLTGIIIWFPKKIKNWRQGLKIKTNANWKRINHDLHNSLGLYSFIFLLVMGLTGLCWSFDWYKNGVSKVLGTQVFGGGKQEGKAGNKDRKDGKIEAPTSALPLSLLIEKGHKELAGNGTTRISIPEEMGKPYSFSKYEQGFFASSQADQLSISPSGTILKKELFNDKPLNEKIAASIKALHIGTFMGTFSKIIYFISCLIATSLPITGTLIWWNKLKKKRRRKVPKATNLVLSNA